MKILSIDPSSNKHKTSTTGIVLLENAKLLDYWVVDYGITNFKKWFQKIGKTIDYDTVIVEEYVVKEGERSRDNTTKETMDFIVSCYPDIVIQNNTGYKTDIPDDLLKKLGLWEFGKSHHSDVRSATRLALFYGLRNNIDDVVYDIGKRLISQVDIEELLSDKELLDEVSISLNTTKEIQNDGKEETSV